MSDTPSSPYGSGDPSALRRLVGDRLAASGGGDLIEFIMKRRETPEVNGKIQDPTPYRRIAYELVQITDIDITHEAVRRWHRAAERAQFEAAAAAARAA
jgi:hypothetical protein